jgi:hypothetical protein
VNRGIRRRRRSTIVGRAVAVERWSTEVKVVVVQADGLLQRARHHQSILITTVAIIKGRRLNMMKGRRQRRRMRRISIIVGRAVLVAHRWSMQQGVEVVQAGGRVQQACWVVPLPTAAAAATSPKCYRR